MVSGSYATPSLASRSLIEVSLEHEKRTGIKIDGHGRKITEKEIQKKKEKITGNTTVVKKDNNNYKKIGSYKSTGLIYDKNLLDRIENKIILKK